MAYNGSGNFSLAQPSFTPGTTISSAAVNSDLSDIATNGLSKCVVIDGQNVITGQLKFPNGTAAAPAFTFSSDLTTGMYYVGTKKLGFSAGGTAALFIDQNNVGTGQTGNQLYLANTAIFNPVGIVNDFAGTTAPAGWLLCDGTVYNFSSYPELGALLTSTYGGNGTTTFGVPDCRGRATYGKDNMGGSAASRITSAGGNFDGTVLGGAGGQQNTVIANGNLPASIPLTDPGHLHSMLARSFSDVGVLAAASGTINGVFDLGTTGGKNANIGSNTTGITINAGGANTALAVLSPGIIFNKIIFAGRP